MTEFLIIISVFLTSILSGFLGMAGGMILMGVYGTLLPVRPAMVLHGVTQAAANGIRAYLLRNNIYWKLLLPYLLGTFLSLLIFKFINFVPKKSYMFLFMGLLPYMALLIPAKKLFDVRKFGIASFSGFLVTKAQLFAGASGPILDIFYVKSPLDRRQIVATKGLTQTIGHTTKLTYYLFFVDFQTQSLRSLSLWIYPAVVATAILGTKIGKMILDRMSEGQYRFLATGIVLLIGAVYIIRGIYLLDE